MASKDATSNRLEQGVSTKPLDIMMRFVKNIPKILKSNIGVGSTLKGLPSYDERLEIPDSGEIYSWIKGICETSHRRPGTTEGHEGEKWVLNEFKKLGFNEVNVDPIPIKVWNAENWSLKVEEVEMPSFFTVNTGLTGPEGMTAPLVYVGKGTSSSFKNVNVTGKIAVAEVTFPHLPLGLIVHLTRLGHIAYHVSNPDHSLGFLKWAYLNFVRENFVGGTNQENAPSDDVYWNTVKAGAKGICLILKDQPSNSNSHYGPYDGVMKPIPGLWIGKYDGIRLKEKALSGSSANLTLNGTIADGSMSNIWCVLPGMTDEIVLVTSHHDAPFKGAVEDGTGVAQVFAQAKIWSKVPLEKRRRTLVFLVAAGHFYGFQGGHTFAKQHPEIMKKVKLLITLEHLGAKEVIEKNQEYTETGQLAYTIMFTSPDPLTIATARNALRKKPTRATASIPYTLFADAPLSDAIGYVLESGTRVISWIGCPYYLLDAQDTLDRVAKNELGPICETITELIKPYMK